MTTMPLKTANVRSSAPSSASSSNPYSPLHRNSLENHIETHNMYQAAGRARMFVAMSSSDTTPNAVGVEDDAGDDNRCSSTMPGIRTRRRNFRVIQEHLRNSAPASIYKGTAPAAAAAAGMGERYPTTTTTTAAASSVAAPRSRLRHRDSIKQVLQTRQGVWALQLTFSVIALLLFTLSMQPWMLMWLQPYVVPSSRVVSTEQQVLVPQPETQLPPPPQAELLLQQQPLVVAATTTPSPTTNVQLLLLNEHDLESLSHVLEELGHHMDDHVVTVSEISETAHRLEDMVKEYEVEEEQPATTTTNPLTPTPMTTTTVNLKAPPLPLWLELTIVTNRIVSGALQMAEMLSKTLDFPRWFLALWVVFLLRLDVDDPREGRRVAIILTLPHLPYIFLVLGCFTLLGLFCYQNREDLFMEWGKIIVAVCLLVVPHLPVKALILFSIVFARMVLDDDKRKKKSCSKKKTAESAASSAAVALTRTTRDYVEYAVCGLGILYCSRKYLSG